MKGQRRKLRKSEWVILLAPLLLLTVWWVTATDNAVVNRYIPIKFSDHMRDINSIEFSADGAYMAVGSNEFAATPPIHELRIWDTRSRQFLWSLRFQDWIGYPVFSLDGKYVAVTVSDKKIMRAADGGIMDAGVCIFDTVTGNKLFTWPTKKYVGHFQFIGQGRQMLIEGQDVRIWDLTTGRSRLLAKEIYSHGLWPVIDKKQMMVAVFMRQNRKPPPKGTNYPGVLRLYDIRSGKVLRELPPLSERASIKGMTFSPDGDEVFIRIRRSNKESEEYNEYRIKWSWRKNQPPVETLGPKLYRRHSTLDASIAIGIEWLWKGTGNDRTIAGSKLHAENMLSATPLWVKELPEKAVQLLFFRDGHYFATLEVNTTDQSWVRVRNSRDGALHREFPGGNTWGSAFRLTPDGKKLAIGSKGAVKLWDVSDLTSSR